MSELSATAIILERIVNGDKNATNDLVKHCYPMLLKWAHGRIPYSEKSLLETTDLVQETLLRGIQRIENFTALRPGAFLAYLRKIFINCINESVRNPSKNANIEDFLNCKTNFSTELDIDGYIYFEKALEKLSDLEQEAVILKIEFGCTYAEIAKEMNKPSEDAARMYVNRSLVKLAKYIEK